MPESAPYGWSTALKFCREWLRAIRALETMPVDDIDWRPYADHEQKSYKRFTVYCARVGVSHNAVYLEAIGQAIK